MNEARMRYSIELRKSIFDQLVSYVTSIALWKILSQYKKLIEHFTVISVCIKIFITIIELSCSHIIQKRLFEEESLLIEDVHSHWRQVIMIDWFFSECWLIIKRVELTDSKEFSKSKSSILFFVYENQR
jgi:hypothetical protein